MSEIGRCGCRRCDPAAWSETNGWVCQPQRRVKELEKENSELHKDRERLDAIERSQLNVEPYGQNWLVWDKTPRMDGSHVSEGATLREAIDNRLSRESKAQKRKE